MEENEKGILTWNLSLPNGPSPWEDISLGLVVFWALVGLWAFYTLIVIVADYRNLWEGEISEQATFNKFRSHQEYKIYHLFVILFEFPAWIIEGVLFLVWKGVFFVGKAFGKVMNITLVRKKKA